MVGHNLIDTVYIEIGGQTIDTHYGDWLNIWNELTQTAEKEAGYNAMIGNTVALTTHTYDVDTGSSTADSTSTPAATLYVPLQFWFCRNPGLALPLIALQYHEVKFNITFSDAASLYTSTGGVPTIGSGFDASLYIDYIYLDTDERRQFAQVQHEYLIEQLQFTGAESVSSGAQSIKSKLALNHPCKELVWVIQEDSSEMADYTGAAAGGHSVVDAKLQLNGQDRFSVRDGAYFNLVQPYQHHTRIPAVGIYVYSFALNPEQHQPSGTVNMSRIDNATLQLSTNISGTGKLRVYAVNYNVFNFWTQKVNREIDLLVKCFLHKKHFATLSNCGNILRAFDTTFIWKHVKGTRLIAECDLYHRCKNLYRFASTNGKNSNDWTIRIQAPYKIISYFWVKVQRLNVSGRVITRLRYSLAPSCQIQELNTSKDGVFAKNYGWH